MRGPLSPVLRSNGRLPRTACPASPSERRTPRKTPSVVPWGKRGHRAALEAPEIGPSDASGAAPVGCNDEGVITLEGPGTHDA